MSSVGPQQASRGRAPARVLSGRELAAQIRADVATEAASLAAAGVVPRLAVVTATADEASAWYVRSLTTIAARAGIACDVTDLVPASGPGSVGSAAGLGSGAGAGSDADGGGSGSAADTLASIETALTQLSADPTVHGIVLQTPLPGGARLADLASAIDPAKDVDGANPVSLGRIMTGLPAFAPATAEAVIRLLDHYEVPLEGARAMVVGRSAVVGKPLAQLLVDRNATVTICHSRTRNLAGVTAFAQVLVVAVGRAALIGPQHLSPGTTVIDVGTNVMPDGGLAGDVSPAVRDVAGALSPVPGGIGPVTTALLLRHVTEAARQALGASGVSGAAASGAAVSGSDPSMLR